MNEGPTVERDGESIVIRIPMTLKRRGGRKQIIVPGGLSSTTPAAPVNQPLVVALARAYHWQDLIESGRYSTISALALALDVDRSYVGRTLRLTALAPDIIEAVLAGNEPDGMSLERLSRGVPVLWMEQLQIA